MNTPNHLTIPEINAFVDDSVLPLDVRDRSVRIIDLQRRYRIEVEREPTLHRLREYTARDLLSFDADPSARWHVIGRGQSPQAAVLDLLDRLMELHEQVDAEPARPRAGHMVSHGPFEPPEFFDDGLEDQT